MTTSTIHPGRDKVGTEVPAVPRRHLAGLDGLRAVAVIAVILYHLSPGYFPGGYIGVDVFFVLSGFLITGLLLNEKHHTGRIALGNFWRRRARRILPALGVLVPTCCAVGWLIGGDVLVGLGKQVVGAVTFSSNWLAVVSEQSYFDAAMPDLFRNLWSLSVEEQFYLLWPIAIVALLLVKNRNIRLAVVATCAVASALVMAALFSPSADPTRVYFGTDTHSFGLTIGAALAIVSQSWPREVLLWPRRALLGLPIAGTVSLVGLVALALTMPADAAITYQGGLFLVSMLTAITIAGCIVPGSRLGRTLDIRGMRWIGRRSYGLYLWHWPVYVLMFSAWPSWARIGEAGWALGGTALCLTVIAAAVSYRYVEQPILRAGFTHVTKSLWQRVHRSQVMRIAGVGGALVFLTAGTMTVGAIASDPGAGDAELTIQAGQDAIAHSPATPEPQAAPPSPASSPTPLPKLPALPALPLTGDRVSAIGDSVMLAAAPGLQAVLPGVAIDAVVSRQMRTAPEIIRGMRDAGTLRHFILIGLGTNGPIDEATLEEIRTIAGADHQIVVVNVYAPRRWTDGVNSALAQFDQRHQDVELADWRDAIADKLNLLSRDQIHPGRTGGQIYADVAYRALERLAAVPPPQPASSPFLVSAQ